VQDLSPSKQVKGVEQPDQAKIVIAVEMGDEDPADPLDMDMKLPELYLGAFCTVYQK
jgi:hypothetical protein